MSRQNENINLCTQHVLQVFWAYNFHELLSYCGLVDAKIRASDKDLPVWHIFSFSNRLKPLAFSYESGNFLWLVKAVNCIVFLFILFFTQKTIFSQINVLWIWIFWKNVNKSLKQSKTASFLIRKCKKEKKKKETVVQYSL